MESTALVIADLSCAPENAEAFGAALQDLAVACRAEPGCLSYEVFRSVERPERYVSVETYAGAEAFQAHRASDHFREIGLARVMPLATARDVRMYGAPQEIPPAGRS